jgi:nucleoside-diphosphate-sugar epimerase
MRIGVLGGSGFIGRRLVERLGAAGNQVRVGDIVPWTTASAEFRPCDVRDPSAVRQFLEGLDAVYNLAAEHRDDVRPVEKYQAVNVGGAEVLCQAARQAGLRRLLFTSSVAVYGSFEGIATEEYPHRPFNEYGRTKSEAEAVYRAWAQQDPSRELVIVRPTVVFGEGNRGNVFNLAQQVARRRFVMVGDGTNRKSMAYVENVAGFLLHCLSLAGGPHVFNYSDGPDLDMNELVALLRERLGIGSGPGFRLPYRAGLALGASLDLVARLTGRSLPFSSVRVAKFCANTRIGAERALASGYRPEVSLREGLERVLLREFPDLAGPGPRR